MTKFESDNTCEQAGYADLEKLTDQQALFNVVKYSRDDDARIEALKLLTDPALLADIANADAEGYLKEWEEVYLECEWCEHREVCGRQHCAPYRKDKSIPDSHTVPASFDLRDLARAYLEIENEKSDRLTNRRNQS